MAGEEVAGQPSGHHVAGGQLRGRVHVAQEAAAPLVDDDGASAPQRFREKGHGIRAHGQGRGVELDELEVSQTRARAGGHGQAVAGGFGGVRHVGRHRSAISGRHGGALKDDRPSCPERRRRWLTVFTSQSRRIFSLDVERRGSGGELTCSAPWRREVGMRRRHLASRVTCGQSRRRAPG
jgi:hypothetical protein